MDPVEGLRKVNLAPTWQKSRILLKAKWPGFLKLPRCIVKDPLLNNASQTSACVRITSKTFENTDSWVPALEILNQIGQDLRICMLNKPPEGADAAGPGTRLGAPGSAVMSLLTLLTLLPGACISEGTISWNGKDGRNRNLVQIHSVWTARMVQF